MRQTDVRIWRIPLFLCVIRKQSCQISVDNRLRDCRNYFRCIHFWNNFYLDWLFLLYRFLWRFFCISLSSLPSFLLRQRHAFSRIQRQLLDWGFSFSNNFLVIFLLLFCFKFIFSQFFSCFLSFPQLLDQLSTTFLVYNCLSFQVLISVFFIILVTFHFK